MSTSTGNHPAAPTKATAVQPAGGNSDSTEVPPKKLHTKPLSVVFAVCFIYFVQDFALVGAGAQGQAIANHFQHAGDTSWITAAITILTVALGPIISHAADYWGRKLFLTVLTMIGAVGGAVVARASSMAMAIAGFTIIGVAFGAQPLLHTVASEVLPRRWRAWAQACVMTSNALGLAAGLVVGGAFNRHENPDGFRFYFLAAMALFTVASAMCLVAYRPLPTTLQVTHTFNEKIAELDWMGYVLLASSLVCFCIGLSWSQNPYSWSDPHTVALFVVGMVLGLVLIVYEALFKKDGMFHHGLFRSNRNFSIVLICVFCEGMSFFAYNVYFAFQVSTLYETDPLIVGVRSSIAWMATIVSSLCTGLYCSSEKKVRWVTVTAFIIFLAFFLCMWRTGKDSSLLVWGYPVLLGWALGMTLVALVTAAQLSIPAEHISVASGLIISMRSLGGTIGIAIYNAVFIHSTQHLGDNVARAATAHGLAPAMGVQFVASLLSHNKSALNNVPGITTSIIDAGTDALLDTYAGGFRWVWFTAAAFSLVAAIASAFLFDPSRAFDGRIDAPLRKTR